MGLTASLSRNCLAAALFSHRLDTENAIMHSGQLAAALALLVFKGIGLVTNGGYVLTGTTAVMAQEGDTAAAALSTPSEATMTDSSPTIADGAPTLPAKVDAPLEATSSMSTAPESSSPSRGDATTTSRVTPSSTSSASCQSPGPPPNRAGSATSSSRCRSAAWNVIPSLLT